MRKEFIMPTWLIVLLVVAVIILVIALVGGFSFSVSAAAVKLLSAVMLS